MDARRTGAAKPGRLGTGHRLARATVFVAAVTIGVVVGVAVTLGKPFGPATTQYLVAGTAGVYLAASIAMGYYRCPSSPGGWLVHLTSAEAAAAMTADQPGGYVHLVASGGIASVAPLIPAKNPWRRRLYFFSCAPNRRWQRFNLPPARRDVAIWIRAADLDGANRAFYRRRLDRAIAWPGRSYTGPAVIESADFGDLGRRFSPSSSMES